MCCHMPDDVNGKVLEQHEQDQAPFHLSGVLSVSLCA